MMLVLAQQLVVTAGTAGTAGFLWQRAGIVKVEPPNFANVARCARNLNNDSCLSRLFF